MIQEEILLLHNLLLLLCLEPPPHKIAMVAIVEIAMVMEYLTQAISVFITQTKDALKKVIVQQLHMSRSSRHLPLLMIGLETKQDRWR